MSNLLYMTDDWEAELTALQAFLVGKKHMYESCPQVLDVKLPIM